MTEQLKQKETLPNFEELELPAHATPENKMEHPVELSAEKARKAVAETTQVETQTNPLDRLRDEEKEAEEVSPTINVYKELPKITLRHELNKIRHKLPAADRALSKVIHQPVVRITSEYVGKTVSRPSGLLGGGLVALVGTSVYLYLANHIGFTYNYGVFLVLFFGGFALGLLIEFVVYLAFSSRRKAHD